MSKNKIILNGVLWTFDSLSNSHQDFDTLVQVEILKELRELRQTNRGHLNCIQDQAEKLWRQVQYLRKELRKRAEAERE